MSRRVHRLLLLAAVLSLTGATNVGRASSNEFNYEIVATSLAGRLTNLTHDPAIDTGPAVASDGRIAFLSSRGGADDLYLMNADGSNVRRVTNGAVDDSGIALAEDLEWSQATWSPRRDQIAFDGKYFASDPATCLQHCAGWDVLVIGADGNGLTRIAVGARAPAWSPDGRRLAYESGVDSYDAAGSVTITRLDGSGSVQVPASNIDSEVGPVWSPDGTELAFQAASQGRFWIYTIRADGTQKRRLTTGHNPTWSPDGRRLTFIDNYQLLTIDRNGKGKRRLSHTGQSVLGAAWSPSGGTLAFVVGTTSGCCPVNRRLETVGADGTHMRVIPGGHVGAQIQATPVWMRDGKRILVTVEYP
jgi:Tol biopolymer transport system component